MKLKMPKSYSIVKARNGFPNLIREVECGGLVMITRRDKHVAVILSVQESDRITKPKSTFAKAYEAWKSRVDFDEVAVEPDYFATLRDRSP